MFQVEIARDLRSHHSLPEEKKRDFSFFLTHFLVLTLLPIRYNGFIGVVSPYGRSHRIDLRRFHTKCPKCQAENSQERRFCRTCGGKFILPCPHCGFEGKGPWKRFCTMISLLISRPV
jgi:predicted RNA-binding Zn-ribbon protein involved in translation (DUF1610 family)